MIVNILLGELFLLNLQALERLLFQVSSPAFTSILISNKISISKESKTGGRVTD